MRILKQRLEVVQDQVITLPFSYKILSLRDQYDEPCIWYLDPELGEDDEETKVRVFTVVTGADLDEEKLKEYTYLGTYLLHGGRFVGHVFTKPYINR